MTLQESIDALRRVANESEQTRVLDLVLINVLAEVAEAVDGLRGRFQQP